MENSLFHVVRLLLPGKQGRQEVHGQQDEHPQSSSSSTSSSPAFFTDKRSSFSLLGIKIPLSFSALSISFLVKCKFSILSCFPKSPPSSPTRPAIPPVALDTRCLAAKPAILKEIPVEFVSKTKSNETVKKRNEDIINPSGNINNHGGG
ncbi:hypothetical protein P5673_002215 [Acropora cervicornis]|uniref:Uncharacterized protein n=1 Tax=Acropora cervicornis TaxID=6130 RepID=A0AAD9VGK5_ACRCE|nr:hypothetical protein P5673_002215 [Acropora cervicornis]